MLSSHILSCVNYNTVIDRAVDSCVLFLYFFHERRIFQVSILSVNMHISSHESSARYIYGLGGVAREIADIFSGMNYAIAGFVVDSEYISGSPVEIMNIPVISFDEYAELSKHAHTSITVSLGEPLHRKRLSEKLAALNLTEGSITLCDYLASDSSVGAGTILHAGSVVSSRCSVGKSCLINKKAMIEHDNSVGDYCVFCPYAVTGGHVAIGNRCFVGLGACIRDRVKVGDDVIIGMGAVVTRDVEDGVVVYGNPARVIRRNLTHKIFG